MGDGGFVKDCCQHCCQFLHPLAVYTMLTQGNIPTLLRTIILSERNFFFFGGGGFNEKPRRGNRNATTPHTNTLLELKKLFDHLAQAQRQVLSLQTEAF